MKKRVFIGLLGLIGLMGNVNAQVSDIPLNEDGAYEKKEVVEVEGATATVLYDRAMMAVADWGFDSELDKNGHGLGYHDRNAGTLVIKGSHKQGVKKVLLTQWVRFIDFELKVRCKDGRAQITATVPTLTAIFEQNGMKRVEKLSKLKEQASNASGKKQDKMDDFMKDVVDYCDGMIALMSERLKKGSGDDDDF